ncbi:NAD-dependent succinate-semialdehyde dehydrogenase [Aquabacterium sp.]|jgi:succinate-semialdehyde dehydrogenase / glutarate-semialdehyde dehydrogenase|uniref:NAD-dependent succinate-semialdehyde dehydrogenase n=1 Tax=Aquabacterium sp. TaxID=1872578 RepID=UPI002488F3ED|nr:NAD-dependent succinate-semialdehyde dehydrogenase [Aquabacterium sp.]MDI1349040.1 NAD-dependent succinate-semialdehyde dehydrogenase [Aquabacterium sp.]
MNTSTSPLAALQDLTLLKTQALIDGQWVNAAQHFDVTDPATGTVLAQVANLGATETEAAIAAANRAWPAWRALPAKARSAILMKWFHLLHQHADDLARIMTAEQGKPLAEAKGEVGYGASFLEWFAEEGRRIYGETVPSTDPSKRFLVLKQAVGVCAAITPWNFPIAMITRKVAPALAAGCPVVIKPAEATPLSALAVAELAQRAGMPPGVLNVITADADRSIEVGKALCASDVVRHLSFTGSTEVGRILMKQCAPTVKKLSLELGGNAPFIVFDDADLDAAVEGALVSKYRNAGQTCVCANRLYAQAGIYERFVEKLTAKVAEMRVGNGFEAGVVQGPLIDDQALAKVEELLGDALAKGAQVRTGGQRAVVPGGQGAFFQPTVLSGVNASMRVAREEIFGPVAPVFKFDTEAEAIALANDTEFGLASYFFSRDIGRIWRVSEGLEYGMVGVNTGVISTCEVPFGGVKQSGLGREGARQGIEDYVEAKYVCLGGLDR